MANPELAVVATNLARSGIAGNTSETYSSHQNQWLAYCNTHSISVLQPSTSDLCLYIAHQYTRGLSAPTISAHLSAIRSLQVSAGMNPMERAPLVSRVLTGVKRSRPAREVKQRLPITTQMLARIAVVVNLAEKEEQMVWTMLLVGVFGLLRLGELIAVGRGVLMWNGIRWSTEGCRLLLPVSKMDQDGRGVWIPFRYNNKKCICPVRALRSWRTRVGSEDGALWNIQATNARKWFIGRVQGLLLRAGVENAHMYTGHSLRKGGAQSLVDMGAPIEEVKALGRWSSESWKRYVR